MDVGAVATMAEGGLFRTLTITAAELIGDAHHIIVYRRDIDLRGSRALHVEVGYGGFPLLLSPFHELFD